MMHKSEGIVLGVLAYNDKKKIVKVFTRSEGIQGFAVARSNKSGKGRIKESLLRPLQIIRMNFLPAHQDKTGKLGEIDSLLSPDTIYTHHNKRIFGLFTSEFLTRALYNHGPDEEVFVYVVNALHNLEKSPEADPDFILNFMSGLAIQMGLFPENNYAQDCPFFDTAEGKFVTQMQSGATTILDPIKSEYMHLWLREYTEGSKLLIRNGKIRGQLTDCWLSFFRFHIPGMRELNTPDLFRDLLY